MSYFNIMENIFFTLKSVKGSPVFSFTGIPLLLKCLSLSCRSIRLM